MKVSVGYLSISFKELKTPAEAQWVLQPAFLESTKARCNKKSMKFLETKNWEIQFGKIGQRMDRNVKLALQLGGPSQHWKVLMPLSSVIQTSTNFINVSIHCC